MNTPTQEQIESWLCEAETMSGPSTNEFATLAYQAGRAAALEELWAGGVELPEQALLVVVRETVLDVGLGDDVRTGGRSELGYALISNAGTFSSEEEAVAALKSVGLPIGWVVMPLSRLLPDLSSKAINYGDRRAAAERKKLRELIRRLYVELFHVDQQLCSVVDEDGTQMCTQGRTVRDVLSDAKQLLGYS